MKKFAFYALGVVTMILSSCGAIKPSSFVKASDGGTWSSIMIREDLTYT